MRIPWLACLMVFPAFGQVLINEILLQPQVESTDPNQTHQWVELYNKGSEAVDLAGWKISGRDGREGSSARDLPAVSLPPGGYLVVHVGEGEDRLEFGEQGADSYTKDPAGTKLWDAATDEVALWAGEKIVDFYAWTSASAPFRPGDAHRAAVEAGIWVEGQALNTSQVQTHPGEFVRSLLAGQSLGRYPDSADSNTLQDFEPGGGGGARGPTLGSTNYSPFFFEETSEEAGRRKVIRLNSGEPWPEKEWTFLYFAACDDRTTEKFCLDSLEDIYKAGGSSAQVNHVFYWDSYSLIKAKTGRDGLVRGYVPSPEEYPIEKDEITKASKLIPLLHPDTRDQNIFLPEQNHGDPATLAEFIRWGKEKFPAKRTAVVILGHGHSWKKTIWDKTSSGAYYSGDPLFIKEMAPVLNGQQLELLIFNTCLMAGIEVLAELSGAARYIVASEEIMPVEGLPYPYVVRYLQENPAAATVDVGRQFVAKFRQHHEDRRTAQTGVREALNAWQALALIEASKIPAVVDAVARFSRDLVPAVDYLNAKFDPTDNVQAALRDIRFGAASTAGVTVYKDRNFIDLAEFAARVRDEPRIPACAKGAADSVIKAVKEAVLDFVASDEVARSTGIHIYFPATRMRNPVEEDPRVFYSDEFDETFDVAQSRPTDADSRRHVYYTNPYALPLRGKTMEKPEQDYAGPVGWPAPAAPLTFVQRTMWSQFLLRYYRPVAEARIVQALGPNGQPIPWQTIEPLTTCGKPYDQINAPVGSQIFIRSDGSSDDDNNRVTPKHYFWDMDSTEPCKQDCRAPSSIDRVDPATVVTDNADEERDRGNTTFDDVEPGEREKTLVVYRCLTPKILDVMAHVWDANHTYRWHDNRDGGSYVQPTSDTHLVRISCGELPRQVGLFAPPGFVTEGDAVLTAVAFAGAAPNNARIANLPTEVTAENLIEVAALPEWQDTSVEPPVVVVDEPNAGRTKTGGREGQLPAVPIPTGKATTVFTHERGEIVIRAIAGKPGPALLKFEAPGLSPVNIPITVQTRIAPAPDEILLQPPGGIRVGQTANLIVVARRGGRAVPDSVFTFYAPESTAVFQNGTRFRNGLGMQVRTDASGRTFAAFQAQANGPVRLQVASGPIIKEIVLFASGGPAQAPTRIRTAQLPPFAALGQEAEIWFEVLAVAQPTANVPVRVSVDTEGVALRGAAAGSREVTLTTDAKGLAVFRFTATTPVRVQATATIQGTQIATQAVVTVVDRPR